MTKSRANARVADSFSLPLRTTEDDLFNKVDVAAFAPITPSLIAPKPSAIASTLFTISSAAKRLSRPSDCRQKLWFSFFFDGTGNNLEADFALRKQSNIAKLYRAHRITEVETGIYSIYIPGIGTYFPEIGDPGGEVSSIAFGARGDDRINFALAEFDQYLKKPIARAAAPSNAIQEINIAVFGFSRGAALARAFFNRLMGTRCSFTRGAWLLKNGSWPVNFRFMGLFDTVASVGNPLSRNNTDYYNPIISDLRAMLKERIEDFPNTQPIKLAFSKGGLPGADPAPGMYDGHCWWANNIHIHPSVEEVRHFVAAHEMRNSFPLESISDFRGRRVKMPAHFYEIIYPGAHSDVGGGYASREGGKSLSAQDHLSLIPLRHMYNFAVRRGVPMLNETQLKEEDFQVGAELCETYNMYMRAVGKSASLGEGFNKHMKMFLSWRFKIMKLKENEKKIMRDVVRESDEYFRKISVSYQSRIEQLTRDLKAAESDLLTVEKMHHESMRSKEDLERSRDLVALRRDEYMKVKAECDAIPDMSKSLTFEDFYDLQLRADIQSIRSSLQAKYGGKKKSDLRPHYKGMVDAFEETVLREDLILDAAVCNLFEKYVHDSLAGFGKDATFPSDPRVIYIGGENKLRFAELAIENTDKMSA